MNNMLKQMMGSVRNMIRIDLEIFAAAGKAMLRFFRDHWLGLVISLGAALLFFWPILPHLSTYSAGGDAMFNAWTIGRGQHCFLSENCPNIVDGNILYPNKSSLLYSEAQLSTALVTMPLRLISDNPIWINNVWTIISFMLAALFMYFLIKYISKGNEFVAVLGGLIFAYAPFRFPAIWHLQSLSIFALPLLVLCILKYLEKAKLRYLIGFFLSYVFLLYASWYQGVFTTLVIGILLLVFLLFRHIPKKLIAKLAMASLLAFVAVMPLAKAYMDFSSQTNAGFGMSDQIAYSASATDFILPSQYTLLGRVVYGLFPSLHVGAYNPDSWSYNGIGLYAAAAFVAVSTVILVRKGDRMAKEKSLPLVIASLVIAFAGLIISIGPFLKLGGGHLYSVGGTHFALAMPYLVVDVLLPQLGFMRSLGRADVLVLFSLCALLAVLPQIVKNFSKQRKIILATILALVVAFELMPVRRVVQVSQSDLYTTPKAYTFIKETKGVDNIIILAADVDIAKNMQDPLYANSVRQYMLWAGYHNKNIYNGFSGFTPPGYYEKLQDFTDFHHDDINKMKALGLNYVLLDKANSQRSPQLGSALEQELGKPLYSDPQFALYKL